MFIFAFGRRAKTVYFGMKHSCRWSLMHNGKYVKRREVMARRRRNLIMKWQNIICLDSHQSKLRILSHCKVPLRMTESYSLFFHVKPFSVTGYNSIIRNLVRMRITSFDDMLRSPFIESAKSSISKLLNASQGQNNQFRVWWFCLVRRQSGIVLFLNSNL